MAKKTPTRPPTTPKPRKATAQPHILHHRDGSLYARGQMLDGEMHGPWEFFRKDGSVMRSGSFDRGAQVGTWTTFAANGRIVKATEMKAKPAAPKKKPEDTATAAKARFTARLLRPKATADAKSDTGEGEWSFLTLPRQASAELPSRGMVSVAGTFNGSPFQATLDPDGEGGHWLKVSDELRKSAGAKVGDTVTLEFAPMAPGEEPEPTVPTDLKKALASAPAKARDVWNDVTPAARRDWIHWITSGKLAETRPKRIATACDMLAKGKRRACCFDRSGMYSKSLSCPVADDQ